ncbi:MAG TPA: hypothetical protein VF559_03095 [Caulobacteraceae bacterium]|jgi:flagellar basal-body rod protein FlgB
MNGLTAAMALKALDGLSLRATATAQNIANAGTASYRPVRVSFEDALARAAAQGTSAVTTLRAGALEEPLQQDLRIDLELATANATAARYSAVAEVLGRQLQIDALAVSGGR